MACFHTKKMCEGLVQTITPKYTYRYRPRDMKLILVSAGNATP